MNNSAENKTACPHCHNDDERMIEPIRWGDKIVSWLCNNCGKTFKLK